MRNMEEALQRQIVQMLLAGVEAGKLAAKEGELRAIRTIRTKSAVPTSSVCAGDPGCARGDGEMGVFALKPLG